MGTESGELGALQRTTDDIVIGVKHKGLIQEIGVGGTDDRWRRRGFAQRKLRVLVLLGYSRRLPRVHPVVQNIIITLLFTF
jgi:hypothetical protein